MPAAHNKLSQHPCFRNLAGAVRRHLSTLAFASSLLFGVAHAAPPAPPAPTAPALAQINAASVAHLKKMRAFVDPQQGVQATPTTLPGFTTAPDPSGDIGTVAAAVVPTNNGFFRPLGTNNRTCLTCHQPQNAWSFSAASAQARFSATNGSDPLFRLVDGATCPTADVSTLAAQAKAYGLLTHKGLIRIGLPLPANAQFRITAISDPYNCNTNPVTGLAAGFGSGIVSIYRRPLPTGNLGFLNTIMWDGREPNLSTQATNAVLGHAQASLPPSPTTIAQIVGFESSVLTAQHADNNAGILSSNGATGGPVNLQAQLNTFLQRPGVAGLFNLFNAWAAPTGPDAAAQAAVARGQAIFNRTTFPITRVAGLNDVQNVNRITGSCSTCHDNPNVGNHSVDTLFNIGIADVPPNGKVPTDLPVFTLVCTSGPLARQTFTVTDPGRALITGACADIGKLKVPALRGLAARAPYFHDGRAASLLDTVNFYDTRFTIGLTAQQKSDLVAFLGSL